LFGFHGSNIFKAYPSLSSWFGLEFQKRLRYGYFKFIC
jgi:hypothetical protein